MIPTGVEGYHIGRAPYKPRRHRRRWGYLAVLSYVTGVVLLYGAVALVWAYGGMQ